MAFVGARVAIKHDHAAVAVAISHEDLVGFRTDHHARRPVQVFGVVAAAGVAMMADLKQELPGFGELQNIGVLGAVAAIRTFSL